MGPPVPAGLGALLLLGALLGVSVCPPRVPSGLQGVAGSHKKLGSPRGIGVPPPESGFPPPRSWGSPKGVGIPTPQLGSPKGVGVP